MALNVVTHTQILSALEQLPPESWVEVQEFIEFLKFKARALRPRQATLGRALGLLATNQPAPSDAEVQSWLDEHRQVKYTPNARPV